MKGKIIKYIKDWETRCYFDGIPDEVEQRIEELNKAPSYKAIVKAILKNDNQLETLGFTANKSIWYHKLKQIEIEQRPFKSKQLKLNL
jgi:predicted phosphoadenosine phosphosulfate sulfurtransferase